MLAKISNIFGLGKGKKGGATQQPKRFNDAVLIIRQDNKESKLHVEASNFLALKLLGGETDQIIEKDLREFLPQHLKELINENVEFSDNGRGIDSVLNKVAYFKIRTINGSEIPLRIRVIRSLSSSVSSPRFQLVMNDSSLLESLEANRENYRADMRGDEIFDKKTGLVSRESIIKDIELISYYTERNHKTSCYAIFKFINYDDLRIEFDEEGAFNMLLSLIHTVETTKRKNDLTGLVAEGAVIVIFPETPKENVKIPINRIYNKLPKELKSQIRIYYDAVKLDTKAEEQINKTLKGEAGKY